MKKYLAAPLTAALSLILVQSTHAQFSFRRTVGDASYNSFTPGMSEAIRFRSGVINSPTLESLTAGSGNFTRHAKQGAYTGIGGSTLQTTSVTSESRSALIRPSSLATGTPLINRPEINFHLESASASPALRSFAVQAPDFESEPLFERTTESFTNQPSLRSRYGAGDFSFDF